MSDTASDERPLRVILFGGQFAALDDAEAMGLSASGPNCVQTMALRLLRSGFDPERPLILFRANQNIGRTTIGKLHNRKVTNGYRIQPISDAAPAAPE
jgi:hypothetical protein